MRNADKKDARCKRERKGKIKTEPETRIASRLSLGLRYKKDTRCKRERKGKIKRARNANGVPAQPGKVRRKRSPSIFRGDT